MDIQLTDFENSALTIFVGMLANIMNFYDLDYVIPITKVDENMKLAHLRDALSTTKFWWKCGAVKRDETGRPLKSNLKDNGYVRGGVGPVREKSATNDEEHLYK